MLLAVMYHHINCNIYSNKLEMMKNHLGYIAKNYNVVLPKDKLSEDKLNVCLTFDDGYYDFYHFVFPLLRELNLKAILATPIKYILEDTKIDKQKRLSLTHNEIYEASNYKDFAPFCTFKELKEMGESGFVDIASHSYSHLNLKNKDICLELELIKSKEILEKKLGFEINSFVLPYGKYNDKIVKMAKENYKYVFRIGNSLNKDFSGINGLIYRVNGDGLQTPNEIFNFSKRMQFYFKYLSSSFSAK